MSQQWHYSQDGAQYGPVDESEIIRLIQDGELAPGTPVLKVGSNDWQPARNHACFQVEIYPKKKRPSAKAATPTTSKPATGGTSHSPRQKAAQPVATSSPTVTTVVVKEKSVLPWVVAGVAVVVLLGVLFFMKGGSDEPSSPSAAAVTTNTPPNPPPATNTPPTPPPATNSPSPNTQPPAANPQLAQTYYERGQNYYWGTGGESKDYAEALKWYRKAAERGHARAQDDLGVLFEKGRGVPQDTMAALMWLTISLMNADAEATPNARTMESKARIVATLAPSHRMFPPEFDELIAKRVQMDVEEAELRAIRCVLSRYNNCG